MLYDEYGKCWPILYVRSLYVWYSYMEKWPFASIYAYYNAFFWNEEITLWTDACAAMHKLKNDCKLETVSCRVEGMATDIYGEIKITTTDRVLWLYMLILILIIKWSYMSLLFLF